MIIKTWNILQILQIHAFDKKNKTNFIIITLSKAYKESMIGNFHGILVYEVLMFILPKYLFLLPHVSYNDLVALQQQLFLNSQTAFCFTLWLTVPVLIRTCIWKKKESSPLCNYLLIKAFYYINLLIQWQLFHYSIRYNAINMY